MSTINPTSDFFYINSGGTNYKISAARVASGTAESPMARGGNVVITTANSYIHIFYESGTFQAKQSIPSTNPFGNMEMFLVGGGGGGGSHTGGGGGGGGIKTNQYPTNAYPAGGQSTIVIGAGGAGGVHPGQNGQDGGTTTIFTTVKAFGGGGGGGSSNPGNFGTMPPTDPAIGTAARGAGGGGGGNAVFPQPPTVGKGRGGFKHGGDAWSLAGGGGGGVDPSPQASGSPAPNSDAPPGAQAGNNGGPTNPPVKAGHGGWGIAISDILGNQVGGLSPGQSSNGNADYIAGGGGGGRNGPAVGFGRNNGGDGKGPNSGSPTFNDGNRGTGGGGGGGGQGDGPGQGSDNGGNGGSGMVIIRYGRPYSNPTTYLAPGAGEATNIFVILN